MPILFAPLSPAAAGGIVAAWLFAIGGAVGSFLNVVIYRLPAGKSLVRPGSHCPACRHPIRWYDNVPLLSWFVLRGRCRDCGCRISFRYPAVEAITAALFVAVGMMEGLSGGANLPLEPVLAVDGTVLPPLDLSRSAAMVGYHLLLLSTLLAAALIEEDGHRPPGRLFAPALLVGWLGPLACPSLHLVPARLVVIQRAVATGLALCDAATGFLLGGLLGIALALPVGKRTLAVVWGPACVGLFLGWKAVLVLMLVAALVDRLWAAVRRRWPRLRPVPPTVWLGLATLAWILAWGWIVGRYPLLG